jgi:hypothetical protein
VTLRYYTRDWRSYNISHSTKIDARLLPIVIREWTSRPGKLLIPVATVRQDQEVPGDRINGDTRDTSGKKEIIF